MAWDMNPSSAPTGHMYLSSMGSDDSIFDFKEATPVDIFMLSTIILSLVISPMIMIFFIRKYLCLPQEVIPEDAEEDFNPIIGCAVKTKRINMEDIFNIEDLESKYAGRSNASSVDRGYNAQYIQCSHYKQQNKSMSFNL